MAWRIDESINGTDPRVSELVFPEVELPQRRVGLQALGQHLDVRGPKIVVDKPDGRDHVGR